MKKTRLICLTLMALLSLPVANASAQIGDRIDRAINRIGGELREGWEEARGAVNRMGLQARVYSRLHWDKELQNAPIEIEVQAPDVVVLRGSVAGQAAKQKAVQLANDTVGVARVEDELVIAQPAPPPQADPEPRR